MTPKKRKPKTHLYDVDLYICTDIQMTVKATSSRQALSKAKARFAKMKARSKWVSMTGGNSSAERID